MKWRFALQHHGESTRRIHVQGKTGEILEDGSTLRGNVEDALLLLFSVHALAVTRDCLLRLIPLILGISACAGNDIEEVKLKRSGVATHGPLLGFVVPFFSSCSISLLALLSLCFGSVVLPLLAFPMTLALQSYPTHYPFPPSNRREILAEDTITIRLRNATPSWICSL